MTEDFPGLPIGQLVLDNHLRVVQACPRLRAMFDGGDPQGSSLDDLVWERDRRGATALASKLNAYRPGTIIDLQLVLEIGPRRRYVRMRLLSEGPQFRAYVEPSDEPQTLMYELALLRQRWTTIFHRSEDGIAVLGAEGKLLEHNQQFLELLKLRSHHGILLSSDALLGRSLPDLLPVELAPLTNALRSNTADFQLQVALGVDTLAISGRTMREPASSRVETFLLVRDVTEQRQIELRDNIIRADLQRAARFQRSILSTLPLLQDADVSLVYEPLDAVGGDVYDAAVLDDGTLRLFIADATGHGIEAALGTILIKNEYDAIKRSGSPSSTLAQLNDRIAFNHANVELMFTSIVIDVDLARDTLRYANGGHPAPRLVRGGEVEQLEEDGAVVGVKAGLQFPEWDLQTGGWESLVLLTDGIIEARDRTGREFGEERVHSAIREARRRGREITSEIIAQVHAHCELAPLRDDMTLLSVNRSATRP